MKEEISPYELMVKLNQMQMCTVLVHVKVLLFKCSRITLHRQDSALMIKHDRITQINFNLTSHCKNHTLHFTFFFVFFFFFNFFIFLFSENNSAPFYFQLSLGDKMLTFKKGKSRRAMPNAEEAI